MVPPRPPGQTLDRRLAVQGVELETQPSKGG